MKPQRFFRLAIFVLALMAFGAACVKEGPPEQKETVEPMELMVLMVKMLTVPVLPAILLLT